MVPISMRKLLCLSLILLALAACTPVNSSDSGIQGRVTVGPMCPVSRPGVPCPDQPYAAALSILAAATGRPVTSVKSDDAGYYKVLLPPGSYIIHPESPGFLPRGVDIEVTVLPHRFTQQDIQYDSGIR
jgi:hypothetical protein